MSKHIPLPLERRGTMVYTVAAPAVRFICQCRTVEQAEEIITALEMHTPMMEALEEALYWCRQDATNDDINPPPTMLEARVTRLRAALKYQPKKETTL